MVVARADRGTDTGDLAHRMRMKDLAPANWRWWFAKKFVMLFLREWNIGLHGLSEVS
jgi:hypothetical protein